MWHWMLAQQGYVVMSIDNRGTTRRAAMPGARASTGRSASSPPRIGAAVRQVLEDRPYLDADRVGVWGWSGGGSMTLNALSVSRSVSRGHLYRARTESAALRHHLSGTLHGPA